MNSQLLSSQTNNDKIQLRFFVICSFLWLVWSGLVLQTSRSHIGAMMDDGEYFVSAVSLSMGNGYRLNSRPGEPIETKYPIGLSAIIATALKISPFQHNLTNDFLIARIVILTFGGILIIFGALFLMNLGASLVVAILIMCASIFHPEVLMLCSTVMSDIPFAAITAVLFWGWTRKNNQNFSIFLEALLCTMASTFRTVGFILFFASLIRHYFFNRKFSKILIILSFAVITFAINSWITYSAKSDLVTSDQYLFYLRIYSSFSMILSSFINEVIRNVSEYSLTVFPLLHVNFLNKFKWLQVILKLFFFCVFVVGTFRIVKNQKGLFPIGIYFVFLFLLLSFWPWHLGLRSWIAFFPLLWWIAINVFTNLKITRIFFCGLLLSQSLATFIAIKLLTSPHMPSDFDEALGFIRTKLPQNSIVMTFYPETIYLYTSRQAIKTQSEMQQVLIQRGIQKDANLFLDDRIKTAQKNFSNRPLYLLRESTQQPSNVNPIFSSSGEQYIIDRL